VAVDIKGVYVNHDDWPSPIGIADSSDWQSKYGEDIAGIGIFGDDGQV
jgi:hypothetical protein